MRQREEAEKNRKKSEMMNWLVRRKIDDEDCGEMIDEKSDVVLNKVDAIGELDQGKLESSKLDIMTVGTENSRGENVGGVGNKEARETEGYYKKIMLLP